MLPNSVVSFAACSAVHCQATFSLDGLYLLLRPFRLFACRPVQACLAGFLLAAGRAAMSVVEGCVRMHDFLLRLQTTVASSRRFTSRHGDYLNDRSGRAIVARLFRRHVTNVPTRLSEHSSIHASTCPSAVRQPPHSPHLPRKVKHNPLS